MRWIVYITELRIKSKRELGESYMGSWIARVKKHLTPDDVFFDDPEKSDGALSCRQVILLLGSWLVLWTLWQSLCIGNAAIDVAENIAWGQNFDWGYDKNPYFGAWFSYAVYRLFHASIGEYIFYFVSLLSAMLGIFAVYLLGRDIFKSQFSASLIIPLALLIRYFSLSASEFNDDILSIPLYGLTGLFFYRSVRNNTVGAWLAVGFCAGLALMTKYLAGALLLPLGLLLLFTPEGRACWKKPGIYLGAALFCLLILPNVFWVVSHDFISIRYALARANLEKMPSWDAHIFNFLIAWGNYLVLLILPLGALFFLPRGKDPGFPKFDRLFVFSVALGPMIITSLFALLTGGKIISSWLTPFFVFVPLYLILCYRPVPARRPLKLLVALVIIFTVIHLGVMANEFLYSRPYTGKHCNHQVYPGKKITAILTKAWREQFGVPCSYVIGNREDSCYMCYYSPDHPRAFFDHDQRLSSWIKPEEIRERAPSSSGAAQISRITSGNIPIPGIWHP